MPKNEHDDGTAMGMSSDELIAEIRNNGGDSKHNDGRRLGILIECSDGSLRHINSVFAVDNLIGIAGKRIVLEIGEEAGGED